MIDGTEQRATVRVPLLVEPSSPSELREGMVTDEIAIAARVGVRLDRREAERIVVSDLALTDAIAREAPAEWTPAPPDPAEQAERVAERDRRIAEELARHGAEVPKGDEGYSIRQSKLIHATSLPDSTWSLAKGRIARILSDRTDHPDIMVATSTCVAPALAREVIALHAFVVASLPGRHTGKWKPQRPGDEPNPFWGLAPDDFGRKFQRLIENICDRSTGIPGLGPWRVPK